MRKKIKGFNDYEIDEGVNVYSLVWGRIHKLSQWVDSRGHYIMIDLSLGHGERVHCLVHRLVAQAFIPNPDNLPEVDHIDKNMKNNNVHNLRWQENSI